MSVESAKANITAPNCPLCGTEAGYDAYGFWCMTCFGSGTLGYDIPCTPEQQHALDVYNAECALFRRFGR